MGWAGLGIGAAIACRIGRNAIRGSLALREQVGCVEIHAGSDRFTGNGAFQFASPMAPKFGPAPGIPAIGANRRLAAYLIDDLQSPTLQCKGRQSPMRRRFASRPPTLL
jgi:hypothetical protein